MKLFIGIAGLFILFATLWDAFETIILPRRVTRPLRLVRLFYRVTWKSGPRSIALIRSKNCATRISAITARFRFWDFRHVGLPADSGVRDAALGRRLRDQRTGTRRRRSGPIST